jgi:hypothetical protein
MCLPPLQDVLPRVIPNLTNCGLKPTKHAYSLIDCTENRADAIASRAIA